MKFSQLAAMEHTHTFTFLGQPISFTYKLGELNKHFNEWLIEFGDESGSLYAALEKLLVWWSLEDDDGSMLPITADVMKDYNGKGIPSPVLNSIYSELRRVSKPSFLIGAN